MFKLLKRVKGEWVVHSKEEDLEEIRKEIEANICKIKKVHKTNDGWWISDNPKEEVLENYKAYFYEIIR